jgi:hypothetical protein
MEEAIARKVFFIADLDEAEFVRMGRRMLNGSREMT